MAAEKKRAEKTSFIIGYIDNDGQPITDRKEMVKRRFAATSFGHDEDSEKQQSESLRGSDADVFGEDGFLWGSGGFEMEIPLLGSLYILRTLLRDANPVSTAIPDKTLVTAGTDVSDILAADYFTATATAAERNPDANRPGRLRFKFSAGNAGGKITVRGVRRVGIASDDTLPMREVLNLSATESETTDVTLEKYFHRINKIEIKDADGDDVSSGTVEVLSSPGGYETILKMSNELIRLMMEAEVGGIPRKITRGEFISGQLNIADTVRLAIEMLSKRVDKRATIEGGDEEKFIGTPAEYPTEFPFVSEKFFPDWGGYLELDGEAFVFDSATVDINRNEDFSAGKRASRFRSDLESSSRRNVTAQIQGSYISGTEPEDKFIRWDEKFRNNEAVAAKIANYHWPTTGRQYSMEFSMDYCEVTSPVRVEANSPGNIPITINLKAVPDPTVAGSSELTVKIVSDDQWT